MHGWLATAALLAALPLAARAAGPCPRFDVKQSSAYDPVAQRIVLPWRTDYPASVPKRRHGWEAVSFKNDWKAYADAVLGDIRASGLTLRDGRLQLPADAPWWIAPWMDYGTAGRERVNGLTRERRPDPGDLSPTSPGTFEVWAVGWYNTEGAAGLGKLFADPCNPVLPAPDAAGWTFPNKTVSFKLLFTSAEGLGYLDGSPTVLAATRGPQNPPRALKLLQVDIAVRDPDATLTGWVMGTFVWKGPATGDGLFDNLVPVGLMWGNDPRARQPDWSAWAKLSQSRINADLAGILWQGAPGTWRQRPFPGFQGRLNGPADNLRSSCLSCHAIARWPRSSRPMSPNYPINATQLPPLTDAQIRETVRDYFRNTRGGKRVNPGDAARPLDYSLQLQTGLANLCRACNDGALAGDMPLLCRTGQPEVPTPTCAVPERPEGITPSGARNAVRSSVEDEPLPRQ